MSKNIGIATMSTWGLRSNYGTFLQHLALRRVVNSLGFAAYRVDGGNLREGVSYWLYPLRSLLSWWLKNGSFRRFFSCVMSRINWFRFQRDYKRYIGTVFEENDKSPFAVITGSDQIWWIGHRCNDPFLKGNYGNARLLSYAASADWELMRDRDDFKNEVIGVERRFNGVSVREHRGVEVCKAIIPNFEVEHVVDPTLLWGREGWDSILPEKKVFSRPTMLCYVVNSQESEELPLEVIKRFATDRSLDLRIVAIQGPEMYVPIKYLTYFSPIDFVRAVRDADCVLVNSFHGLMFSIIYRKNFVFLPQSNLCLWDEKVHWDQNRRQREVLEDYALTNRELSGTVTYSALMNLFASKIEWDEIYKRINLRRAQSLDWLKMKLS